LIDCVAKFGFSLIFVTRHKD